MAPPAAQQDRARSYWLLAIYTPACDRHGAQGHSATKVPQSFLAWVWPGFAAKSDDLAS